MASEDFGNKGPSNSKQCAQNRISEAMCEWGERFCDQNFDYNLTLKGLKRRCQSRQRAIERIDRSTVARISSSQRHLSTL